MCFIFVNDKINESIKLGNNIYYRSLNTNLIINDEYYKQFHTVGNLAKSIRIGASELLECFQLSDTAYDLEHIKEELVDVLNYCVQISQVLYLNVVDILNTKIDKDKKKYLLEKSKGRTSLITIVDTVLQNIKN